MRIRTCHFQSPSGIEYSQDMEILSRDSILWKKEKAVCHVWFLVFKNYKVDTFHFLRLTRIWTIWNKIVVVVGIKVAYKFLSDRCEIQ